jgi:hypothetical protein
LLFQLREDHIRALESVAEDNFADRGVQHLRRILPEATASETDDQLRERVFECVGRAGKYGLATEQQVMSFADATYLAGEHFDTDPACTWAPDILMSSKLSRDDKAVWVLASASASVNGKDQK